MKLFHLSLVMLCLSATACQTTTLNQQPPQAETPKPLPGGDPSVEIYPLQGE